MRSLFIAILFAGACAHSATGPQPVNVAAVRNEIKVKLDDGRTIQSMGKTSNDRAVVYTASKDGARQEEVWVKASGTWTLETKTALK
jgi:hypothetical protein